MFAWLWLEFSDELDRIWAMYGLSVFEGDSFEALLAGTFDSSCTNFGVSN